MAGETYQITTFTDIVDAYLAVEPERRELLLKEMNDAVRIVAPMVEGARTLGADFTYTPIRWVNDVKGRGTVKVSADDGEELLNINMKLGAGAPA